MDIKIEKGDILTDMSGKYVFVKGIEEAVQRVFICTRMPKGSFIYNKSLGTDMLGVDTLSPRALPTFQMLLNEALFPLDGMYAEVEDFVAYDNGDIKLYIKINYAGDSTCTEVKVFADV